MDLAAMIGQFRVQAQDARKPYLWPDSELEYWFSEAESEAAVRARLLRDTDEFSIASGNNDPLELPIGLFDIQHAELRASDGTTYEISATSRRDLDWLRPGWRSRAERPTNYVHDDKQLILSSLPDQDYTLYLEFFRLPKNRLEGDDDEPEIAEAHHANLIDWVLFRAYSKPDADAFDANKSAVSLAAFERYFGASTNADLRRRQNASRPHRNRVHL